MKATSLILLTILWGSIVVGWWALIVYVLFHFIGKYW